jgi:uncharacterized membrane protein SpoIIM required for sporulation
MKLVFMISLVLGCLIAGTYCLFFTAKVQADDIRSAESGLRGSIPGVKRFVRSNQYMVSTRIVGIVFYLMAVGLVIGLLNKGHLPVRW